MENTDIWVTAAKVKSDSEMLYDRLVAVEARNQALEGRVALLESLLFNLADNTAKMLHR